jgi:pimeloyl-ACP methyl ester carboxylesterase
VLLLLHGNSFDGRVFDRQVGILARRFRVIVADLPGHGLSGHSSNGEAYTLTGMAEAILDAMATLCSSFAVYGWSLGGHVALEMVRTSSCVEGAMISGAPPLGPGLLSLLSSFKPNLIARLAAKESWTDEQFARFHSKALGRDLGLLPYSPDGKARPIIARSLLKGVGRLQRAVVEQGNTPVHLIATDSDPFLRPGYMLNVKPACDPLNGTTLIKSSGHAPFIDQPSKFDTIVTNFMNALHRGADVYDLQASR